MEIKLKNWTELVWISHMPMHHAVKLRKPVNFDPHNLKPYLDCVKLYLLQYQLSSSSSSSKYEPSGQDSVSAFSQLFSSCSSPISRRT
jgi:hypothetical protein